MKFSNHVVPTRHFMSLLFEQLLKLYLEQLFFKKPYSLAFYILKSEFWIYIWVMLTFRWMKDILLYGLYLIELITLSKFISTCILNVRITSSQKWSVCKYIFKTKLSLYDYLCDYFVESAGNFFSVFPLLQAMHILSMICQKPLCSSYVHINLCSPCL